MTSFTKERVVGTWAPRGPIGRVLAALAFAGVAAACGDSSGPQRLATLTITPASATLDAGGTQQFTVVGTDNDGDAVTVDAEVWSVVSGGGTINSSTGLFTAGPVAGTFTNTVRVTCNGITANATVIVNAGPLATIVVTPNPATMAINATQQFTAVGRDANGNVVAITPVWSTTNPPGTINASTGLFTAGNTTGTFANSVRATQGTISGTATVTVIPGPLATITVTPNPVTLQTGAQQQFTAVGRDAGGNVVPITPVWSTTDPPGTINASTGLFTAGNTTGSFANSVRATQGTIFGTATVNVTAPPPPPSSTFRVLANAAVSCTDGSITGDVGTFQAAGEVPPGSITPSNCPITGGTAQVGTVNSKQAYTSFVSSYNSLATTACGTVLTGTLANVTLAPGVYCFDAAASLTGTLTLNGPATGVWLFKIGTSGTGALTGTGFTVVMAGGASACNVTWWVRQAATMTDSNLRGNVLAGNAITLTRGTFRGNAWAQGDVTITGTVLSPCDAP
jgi:hypothetical protein